MRRRKKYFFENASVRVELRFRHQISEPFIERLEDLVAEFGLGALRFRQRVGHVIGDYRFSLRISQRELAELSGIPQGELCRLENHQRLPSVHRAQQLAKVFGCDYRVFL